jgi:hypothetical protein
MWLFEYTNPGTGPFEQRGTVELNLDHVAERKPLWLVMLKLVALAAMIALGLALVMPLIPLPSRQATAVASFVLFVYCVVAHYVRPQPNTDNLGWFGGLMNDPLQFNDNLNRLLFKLHCFLGPGRFASAAVIDALVAGRLLPERTVADVQTDKQAAADEERLIREQEILARVAERQARQACQHTMELASQRFFTPPVDGAE